jgi:hypothetical protein
LYALLLLRALQQAEEDEMEMERHLSSHSAFTYANDDSNSDMYGDNNYDNEHNNNANNDSEDDPDDDVSNHVEVRNGRNSTVDAAAAEDAVSETDRLIQRYNARQQQQQQQPVSPTTDTDTGIDSAAAAVRSYTAADLYHLRECFEDSSDSDAVAAAAAAAASVGRVRTSTVPHSYATGSGSSYHYDEAHAAATSSATARDTEGRSAAASAAAGAAATSAGRTTDSCDDTESAGAMYCGLTGKYQGYAASKQQSGNTAVGAVLLSKAVQSAREEELCVLSLVCDAALSAVLARSAVVQLLLLLVPQPTADSINSDSGGNNSNSCSSDSSVHATAAVRKVFAAVLTSSSSRTRDAALRLLKLLVRSGLQSRSPLEHALHSAVWGNSDSPDTLSLHTQQVSPCLSTYALQSQTATHWLRVSAALQVIMGLQFTLSRTLGSDAHIAMRAQCTGTLKLVAYASHSSLQTHFA